MLIGNTTSNIPSLESRLKSKVRSFSFLHALIRGLYSYPHLNVAARKNFRRLRTMVLNTVSEPKILIIGGGIESSGGYLKALGTDLLNNAVNIELKRGSAVNIVGDGTTLPFLGRVYDVVIAQAVLEHVRDPGEMIKETCRVMSDGGYFYTEVPFIQPYHAYPADFQRYTVSGLERLCKDFQKIDSGIVCGPGSAFSWILIEFLSILFSCNSESAYVVLNFLFRMIFSPLKYLDLFMNNLKNADRIASGVYFLGQKSKG